MSSSEHLLVSWASQIFSFAKCSSRSNRSRGGGSNSLREGGKIAACNAGIGVSKVGGINVRCWWTTSKSLNIFTVSGTLVVSNLNNSGENNFVKSLFKGALSYKHDHKFSLREDVSGTLWYSVIY